MTTMRLLCFIAVFLSFYAISTAESVLFVPVTPETTRLADGAAVSEKSSQPEIQLVWINGLEAGAVFEVFGYFWAEDIDSEQHNPVQFGLTLATLHPFGGERLDAQVSREPWIVTPGYETGKAYGYQAVIEENDPLPGLKKLETSRDTSRLIRARIGYSRA